MNNELKAILEDILIELRSINKKLDAVTPSSNETLIDNKKVIDDIGQSVRLAVSGMVSSPQESNLKRNKR
ncbi:hypothetical protein ACWG0P_07315 [Amedibacillus sp. YH-ame6]